MLLIPSQYVIKKDRITGVYIDFNGRSVWREIQVGIEGQANVEVNKGLQLKDRVVMPVKSQSKLSDGRRIKFQ